MPKPFPVEFRRDVVAVPRKHEAPISQIAKAKVAAAHSVTSKR